jgi:hypothetical protein
LVFQEDFSKIFTHQNSIHIFFCLQHTQIPSLLESLTFRYPNNTRWRVWSTKLLFVQHAKVYFFYVLLTVQRDISVQ